MKHQNGAEAQDLLPLNAFAAWEALQEDAKNADSKGSFALVLKIIQHIFRL